MSETPPPAASKGRSFVQRLVSTLILWAVVAAAVSFQLPVLFHVIFAAFLGLGLIEFFYLFRDISGSLTRILTLLLTAIYFLIFSHHCLTTGKAPGFLGDIITLIAVLQGTFWLAYRFQPKGTTTLLKIFGATFGFTFLALSFMFLMRILYLPGASNVAGLPGAWLLLFVIIVTKFADMGAYAIGSLFGRHKMIPHISPGKSWEGFIGAILGALIAGHGIALWLGDTLAPLNNHWHVAILSLILVVAGIGGDLAESVIKRCLSAKDSGHSIPGIGGIMDLTDSLLFTAPVAYTYLITFFPLL